MREKFLIAILIIAAAATELFPGVSAQDAATKAQQLIKQARAALGGDKLKSLSATGNYRRTLGQMEMSGEVNYDLLLPDKMMKTETMNPAPGLKSRVSKRSMEKTCGKTSNNMAAEAGCSSSGAAP